MSTLTRHPVTPEDYRRGYDDKAVNDACDTLYGVGDRLRVEDAMVARFARVLERVKDGDSGGETTRLVGFKSIIDAATKAAIQDGQFEICRTQTFDSICGATATLFPGSRWEYDNDTAGEIIADTRSMSGANMATLRWDTIAVGVRSCVLYLEAKGDVITETEVRPTAIWVIHAPTITADDGKERATNTMVFDEASLVVMALNGPDQYAAWWGPSELYPTGRHCIFTAKKFSDIPTPNDKSGVEFTIEGEYNNSVTLTNEMLANPLSLWAIKGNASPPVYPFAVLYGTPQSSGLIPTSTSLYRTGLEFDLASSLIMGAAGRGARGAQVLKQTGGDADPSDVPSNTSEGLIIPGRNKDLNFDGWSPTHAAAANEVLAKMASQIAHAAHVPTHIFMPEEGGAPMSGTAIRQKSKSMTDFRSLRIDMNRTNVARRWEIEKALINAGAGKAAIPEETVETWKPKDIEFAIDPADEMADWEARIRIGEASIIDVIMARRGFSNVNDALAWAANRKKILDANRELLDSFKPSAPAAPAAAPARGGLFGTRT